MAALGAFSESAGITEHLLENGPLPLINNIPNGLAIEIKNYCDKRGYTTARFVNILANINPLFATASTTAIVNKCNYVKSQKNKLLHKKKVKGVKNVNELMQNCFQCPQTKCEVKSIPSPDQTVSPIKHVTLETRAVSPSKNEPSVTEKVISLATQTDVTETFYDELKNFNVLTYKTIVKERKLEKLTSEIHKGKEHLESLRGHYSVKNVNKRDQTARQNVKKLRNKERIVRQLQADLKSKSAEVAGLASLKNQQNEINKLISENEDLKHQLKLLTEAVDLEKSKKVALQKSNSYLKTELNHFKSKTKDANKSCNDNDCEGCASIPEKVKLLTLQLSEKEHIIYEIEEKLDEYKTNNFRIKTKSDKGVYTPNVRLCVMELAALEVATEKMAPVIKSVITHLTGSEVQDLPNGTTSQKIIDEGHYLCKAYIAEQLEQSKHWGMGRDGTTRRKQKILDTSITLDSGETVTLGFTRVAQETAETIQTVTEKHLDQLTSVKNNPEYLADTLSKLTFTMSDRASNEKKADRLLDEWRSEMLAEYSGEKEDVLHFHCMAHVLLGLHNYSTPVLKDFEKSLKSNDPNSESEKVSFFTPWKSESVTNRVVRQVSETFAPAGSHLGVRDRWEAYCAKNGIKSLIGNYKDNRFNALFQTSAEVFLHRKDFVNVLDTVTNPNGKLASVKKELQSDNIAAILQCLGLFYLKFTGPYWNLVTSGKVSYLQLWKHVSEIVSFLETLESNPAHLLLNDQHWSSLDPLDIRLVPNKKLLSESLFEVQEESRDTLLGAIPVVAAAMLKCVRKQLVDFLPEGKFYNTTNDKKTSFASVTNLACERQFGGLDASQTRRPGASLHHHSSVLMLKENREQLVKWLNDMKEDEKEQLMSDARYGGKKLRKDYQEYEREVLNSISEKMSLDTSKKQKKVLKGEKRKMTDCAKGKKKQKMSHSQTKTIDPPRPLNILLNEYVAVAYQDDWYPGCVQKVINDSTFEVNFMSHCAKKGHFQWPRRQDQQIVEKQFILCSGFVPDCVSSGRLWFVKEHESISSSYAEYEDMYF